MSSTISNKVKSNSINSEKICSSESESDSSIEINERTWQNKGAAVVVNKNEYVLPEKIDIPIRDFNAPSCSQSSVPFPNNDSRPNINSITLTESPNPMFGNQTYLKGQITINNFIAEENSKEKSKKTEPQQDESADYINSNTNQQSTNEKGKYSDDST